MTTCTPLTDNDHKLDIMDHVNQDHSEELRVIAQYHTRQSAFQTAKILDIYEEGILLALLDEQGKECDTKMVPFELKGSLEDNILYLAYAAVIKQGKSFSGAQTRFFEVIGKQALTPSITRLCVYSRSPLPEYYPGYAFALRLRTAQKSAIIDAPKTAKKSWKKNLFDRCFIWLMKRLPSAQREKLVSQANKDVRLYTLRKSWAEAAGKPTHYGYIDIFTHGQSAGSVWVEQLSLGDMIMSRSENADRHAHLSQGKALLIADETAFPAVAGLLECWTNPEPPHLIILSVSAEEQRYFDNCTLPEGTIVERIVCAPEQQASKVLASLDKGARIDVAWAALESESAKLIRHHLRHHYHLQGKDNHTKAYWRLRAH